MALALLVACGVAVIEAAGPAKAAFPGTNGKIVFYESDWGEGDSGIKLINQRGSGLTTLLADGSSPAVSPDGARVAYSASDGRDYEIYKLNISNRRITRITRNDTRDANPTWSPDGTRVAFEHDRAIAGGTDTDIFARKADGTGTSLNLTKTPNEDEFAPAWSPDGEEIAFRTGGDIFVLELETSQRRNLTEDGTAHHDSDPSWSSDSTRIVFESYPYANPDFDEIVYERIYTMDAFDGSDRSLLAQARDWEPREPVQRLLRRRLLAERQEGGVREGELRSVGRP